MCALLESGKNVVTTAFLFYPKALPAADLAKLEAACEKGQATVHGAGLNPGLDFRYLAADNVRHDAQAGAYPPARAR